MHKKVIFFGLLMFTFFNIATIANAGFFASEYISSYSANVHANSDGSLEIGCVIQAPRTVNQLGVQTVVLQERSASASASQWSAVKTYSYTSYSNMLRTNSAIHSCALTYDNATSGYYYRAKVYFYSEKGGYDTREYITSATQAK